MSIGIANICSSVQDHRQKFISQALVLIELKEVEEDLRKPFEKPLEKI